jgi:hypothetical protein
MKLSHLNGNRNGRELRGIFGSREGRDVVEVKVVIADERVEVESRDTKEKTIMNQVREQGSNLRPLPRWQTNIGVGVHGGHSINQM